MELENNVPQQPFFPAKKGEWAFLGLSILFGWLLCNSVMFAGLNLGFALFAAGSLLSVTGYLLSRGHRLTAYSGSLLVCSLVIIASFARGDDGFVKFVLFLFLMVSVNLGLCLLSRQNLRLPQGFLSLLDAPRAALMLSLGKLPESCRGLKNAISSGSPAGKKGSAVVLGLVIALPVLLVVIPLLVSADAAFDGLLALLPDFDVAEIVTTLIFGTLLALYFYTRGTALHHAPKTHPEAKGHKGLNPLTVNTVLIALTVVYLAYLFSQLAYFSGGFSGILPEDYTLAKYARRGFFEMAWLCAINLGLIALGVGLVQKKDQAPMVTRLLCLFIGLATLFLVVSASAKMLLYIDSFGLTRLRVLTEVIMVFLGLATVAVCLWLFLPKLPYMKVVLLTALVMGAAVAWADVDTQVARYNVTAYQSGKLSSVDVWYLYDLGSGAVPYLAELTQDTDPEVARTAKEALENSCLSLSDFRSWNYAAWSAQPYLPKEEAEVQDVP